MDENMKKTMGEDAQQEEVQVPEEQQEEVVASKEEQACPSIFDKPDPERYRKNQKPPKQSNRKVRDIIIALVLCVALIGSTTGICYLFYGKGPFAVIKQWVSDTEETASNTSSTEQLLVHDYSSYSQSNANTQTLQLGGIKKITVQQPNFTYEITGKMEKTVDINPETYEEYETEIMNWRVSYVEGVDIEGVQFDPTLSGFVVSDLVKIPYGAVYAENGNATIPQGGKTYYDECGITTSQNRLTMEFNNGASITVIVGDKAPTGEMYFLALENNDGGKPNVAGAPKADSRIYTVGKDVIAYYAKDPIFFVEKDVVSPTPQDDDEFNEETGETTEDPYFISGELSKFDALSITGANYEKPFTFEMVSQDKPGYDSIYLMTSPFTQNVDLDAMSALLSPLSAGLSVSDCLVLKATEDDLKKYGFDNPATKVRYVVKGQETVLLVGNQLEEDKGYAFMVEGNTSIFSISKESIPFAFYTTADFASSTLYSCDITLLKTMRIQSDGKDEIYHLKHGTASDGSASLTVTTGSGKTVDTEKFRDMYVKLLSLTSFEEVTDGKDAESPHTTITITYNDYAQTDVIRLSPYTDRRYYMSLNGMGSTVIRSTALDDFVASFNGLFA